MIFLAMLTQLDQKKICWQNHIVECLNRQDHNGLYWTRMWFFCSLKRCSLKRATWRDYFLQLGSFQNHEILWKYIFGKSIDNGWKDYKVQWTRCYLLNEIPSCNSEIFYTQFTLQAVEPTVVCINRCGSELVYGQHRPSLNQAKKFWVKPWTLYEIFDHCLLILVSWIWYCEIVQMNARVCRWISCYDYWRCSPWCI